MKLGLIGCGKTGSTLLQGAVEAGSNAAVIEYSAARAG